MNKTGRYRIYTEEKNLSLVTQRIVETVGGFTLYYATGFWKSKSEHSAVFEFLIRGDRSQSDEEILKIAKWIKDLNKQESVLITTEEVEAEFI